jgi:hypothetical protein
MASRAKLVKRIHGFPSASRTIAKIPKSQADPNGYFRDLGIDPSASLKEIKDAYRMWARIYHPEGEEPDPEQWLYISHIYRVLSNPDRRKEYQDSVGPYISEWEMQAAFDSSPDLIQGLKAEEDIEIKEKPEVEVIPQGYSFWCLNGNEYEELVQEWYRYFLEATHPFRIDMPIQIGVGEIGRPFFMQVLPTKRVVFWVDRKIFPNGFTAFAAICNFIYG